MTSSQITSQQIDGKTATYFIFLGSKNHYVHCSHEIWKETNKKTLSPWKENYDTPRQHMKFMLMYSKTNTIV